LVLLNIKSGVAMVVVANAAVSSDGATSTYNLRVDKDEYIPGLTRLARVIKQWCHSMSAI
jgi:2,4-dienoyl-CoA reductase (NADPH2)